MGQPGLDKHQLAGFDVRLRGFSRPIEFEQREEGYCAVFRYETTRVESPFQATQDAALRLLIQTLHAHGYRQLRTQMSFRGGVYLGSQEAWVEYQDPQPDPEPEGLMTRLLSWFRPRAAKE
ncbi:MAG: hypothetical protein RI101_06150 [Nitrospira sp.]|jgi:hypothetical protein|nr:hypothetical protein [Nitrospira sp.]